MLIIIGMSAAIKFSIFAFICFWCMTWHWITELINQCVLPTSTFRLVLRYYPSFWVTHHYLFYIRLYIRLNGWASDAHVPEHLCTFAITVFMGTGENLIVSSICRFLRLRGLRAPATKNNRPPFGWLFVFLVGGVDERRLLVRERAQCANDRRAKPGPE